MRLILTCLFLSFFSFSCSNYSTEAQIRVDANGKVNGDSNQTRQSVIDISTIDFQNFTYPDFYAKNEGKTFTLKNGEFVYVDEKQTDSRNYKLRKTYYFDITGDKKNEAITHIFAETGAESTDPQSVFFVHSIENRQPKLIWKIAAGKEELGGLKFVHFKNKEIILETFGNCSIKDWSIVASFDVKNVGKIENASFTRFVFTLENNAFVQTSREVLPLPKVNMMNYRPQILFGEQQQ